jgi:primosomal protein N' (replication factor Y)
LLSLPQRAASAELPKVYIDDLTEGYRRGKPSILSDDLHRRIEDALDSGRQAILFLNRRAYAPFIICRDCGHQMCCPNCAVSLSFHRKDGKLKCHHCGYQTRPPETCPQCGGARLNPFGVGTEKVEESVAQIFPDSRIARLDRDIAKRKGALEEILTQFRSGDIRILVGTQMIAKGLDFPNVTVVGVIAADVSLNIPDFRSSERTFQLLSQVAGRAGRGTALGSVVIQTFNPNHISVRTAQDHDFVSFYESIKEERSTAGYPPFRRLVNILLTGELRPAVLQAGEEALARLKSLGSGVQILGPVDCAVERIQGRWRRHLLLKLPPAFPSVSVGEAMLGFAPKGVQVVVDVDPYSLM